jgi:Domain of unknown function (DUF4328)
MVGRSVRSGAVLGMIMLGTIGLDVALRWTVPAVDLLYLEDVAGAPEWGPAVERIAIAVENVVRWAAIVLFLVWIYRAARNVRALGRKGMTITPGWCVGWFFVPIAMLFMPYRAMREIAVTSDAEGKGQTPAFVLGWWLLFLGDRILSMVRGVVLDHADLATHIAFEVANDIVATAALVALFLTVRFISRGQEHWTRHPEASGLEPTLQTG